MMYNFTPRANDLLAHTQLIAKKFGYNEINSLHLLHAALSIPDSLLKELLVDEQRVNVDKLISRVEELLKLNHFPGVDSPNDEVKVPTSANVTRLLKLANNISKKMDHSFIGTEHIILSIVCETECEASSFLYEHGVDLPGLATSLKLYLNPQQNTGEDSKPVGEHSVSTGGEGSDVKPGEALQMFSINLTELAKQDELDPVIGRDSEIERVMQVLSRRQKNNPILVGEPGVGKTAVVEGLCNLIAQDKVPLQLKDKNIYNLDLSLMVAGTKFRGQFEERMKQVMEDLMSVNNAIVFIDEIHMLVGAGNADGAMDAANILKPALSRGGICCIGTTTFDEYREFIESDGALERRFQKIVVSEPDGELTFDILNGLKYKYEQFHNVEYTAAAIDTAIQLSDRYITDRFFPDKAIDILDECAARERLSRGKIPKSVDNIQQRIEECIELTKEHISKDEYMEAATYRNAEKRYQKKKYNIIEKVKNNQKILVIDQEQIRKTVSSWCGVPLQHLKKSEGKKLASLENNLNKKVIGQREAVTKICDSIIRGRTDVGDPERPVGSFLLMGPTGVGKTFLAKQLAHHVYGDEQNMIRVDMSELMEAHSVSKLIGSPPGYVGYGEGGQLTEQIRYNPYSVVLFDEIEKAHPDVMQLLLQLLDEGQLTDSRGVTVNFRNCIVLMTSNIGADRMQKNHVVGFGATDQDNMDGVKKMLRQHLRPEFINRLDEIVMFNSLTKEVCNNILNNELKKFITRMGTKQVKVQITKPVRKLLIDEGFDTKYGARPLRRVIQSRVQTPLAKHMLLNDGPLDLSIQLNNGVVVIEQKETPAG